MRSGLLVLTIAAFAGCGPDLGDSFDFAIQDLREEKDFGQRLDGAPDDLPFSPDLNCGCSTPPAAQCGRNAVVTFMTGSCVADADSGVRCDYPQTQSPCTYGCFNATCNSTALNYFGYVFAFVNGTAMPDPANGSATAGMPVTIIAQTYPPGSASDVHIVYTKSTDPSFAMATDAVFTYDKFTMNNDQWYVIIPGQAAGTTIVWYLYADGYGLTMPSYYSNFGNNFRYTSN
jgi:hypothetical protein